MTDWTSISVTEEQKAILEDHKPEEKAMGRFLVSVVDGDTGGADGPMADFDEETLQENWDAVVSASIPDDIGPVQLDATEYSKIADEIEGRLR